MSEEQQEEKKPEADAKDSPDVSMTPPQMYGAAMFVGILLDLVLPLGFFPYWAQFLFGVPLALGGTLLASWSFRTFSEAGTNVPLDLPTTAIVKTGPYAKARNPIYIGISMVYLGIAMLFDFGWSFLFALPLLYHMDKKVVTAEETYLEKKFGSEYTDYKDAVKRWGKF